MFYVIYPLAEISHWNGLMTSILEFWKIEWKTYDVSDEIKMNKKIIYCDLN
jgi:hypothetical protein